MSLRGAWNKTRRIVWGEIPQSKEERRLLLKIDWFILSYCCLMVSCNAILYPSQSLMLFSYKYFTNCTLSHHLIGQIQTNLDCVRLDLDRSNISNAYVSAEEDSCSWYLWPGVFVSFFLLVVTDSSRLFLYTILEK